MGACLLAGSLLAGSAGAQEQQALFEAPAEGDAGTLLTFMKQLAQPGHDFESREDAERYSRKAAAAIATTADRVVNGPADDRQKIKAIEFKLRSLKLLDGLDDANARSAADAYLAKVRNDENPALAIAGLRLHLTERLAQWRMLPESEKSATLDELREVVSRDAPNNDPVLIEKLRLLTFVADVLGDTPDRQRILDLIEPLMPRFEALRAEADPGSAELKKLAALEGVVRRLNLPGQPIEVEGTLLSGETLHWESYRGKVVLIDYWATWCGLCNAELPNVRRLHRKYADQGFEVLGVCLNDEKQPVVRFLEKQNLRWPMLFGHRKESRGWNHPMVGKYGIFDLPRAILVDRQGRVVHTNARGEKLEVALRQLFDGNANGQPVAVQDHAAPGISATNSSPNAVQAVQLNAVDKP